MSRLAKFASHVFVSSRQEAQRVKRLHPELENVTPVGLSVSSELINAKPLMPNKLKPDNQFLLFVGRLNIRKNLSTAISAAVLSKSFENGMNIVVAGENERSGLKLINYSNIKKFIMDNRITFLGKVSNQELKWLYSNASTFVFLSLDEGFGLPLLEAINFNCPILASDIAVFREILGTKAVYVDPRNVSQITSAIDQLINSSLTNQDFNELSCKYSWEYTVENIRTKSIESIINSN